MSEDTPGRTRTSTGFEAVGTEFVNDTSVATGHVAGADTVDALVAARSYLQRLRVAEAAVSDARDLMARNRSKMHRIKDDQMTIVLPAKRARVDRLRQLLEASEKEVLEGQRMLLDIDDMIREMGAVNQM